MLLYSQMPVLLELRYFLKSMFLIEAPLFDLYEEWKTKTQSKKKHSSPRAPGIDQMVGVGWPLELWAAYWFTLDCIWSKTQLIISLNVSRIKDKVQLRFPLEPPKVSNSLCHGQRNGLCPFLTQSMFFVRCLDTSKNKQKLWTLRHIYWLIYFSRSQKDP